MANPEYNAYLRSAEWQAIRKVVLARDKWRCKLCNSDRDVQVHHRTYEHIFHEASHLEDLVTLCGDCHNAFHKRGKPQRKQTRTPRKQQKRIPKKQSKPAAHRKGYEPVTIHGGKDMLAEVERLKAIGPAPFLAEPIVLTKELLNDLMTPRGGYSSATINALGVSSLIRGWKKKLVGKTITRMQWETAWRGRAILVK